MYKDVEISRVYWGDIPVKEVWTIQDFKNWKELQDYVKEHLNDIMFHTIYLGDCTYTVEDVLNHAFRPMTLEQLGIV